MYEITCETHDVEHRTETEQAAHKHVNVHKEMHMGCDDVSYAELDD